MKKEVNRTLLSNAPSDEDSFYDENIRPGILRDFIGQREIKENLKVFLTAARRRKEPLDHVLLYGSPGLGKTTLAHIIAREMGSLIKTTSGPAIERPLDLVIALKSLGEGSILFIDEIHRLKRPIEEILYPAMEDFNLERVLSKGVAARPIKIEIPPFTLIGATTRGGAISSPLRSRFGILLSLHFYEISQLSQIVDRSARIMGIKISSEASLEVARRSRGTPRIANRLLRRVRDFAEVREMQLTKELVIYAMERLGIDGEGLDQVDRKILETLVFKFNGRPVGLDTLAAMVNEERENIEEVYEPYLLQLGFLDKTPRGRMATPSLYEYLGVACPENI